MIDIYGAAFAEPDKSNPLYIIGYIIFYAPLLAFAAFIAFTIYILIKDFPGDGILSKISITFMILLVSTGPVIGYMSVASRDHEKVTDQQVADAANGIYDATFTAVNPQNTGFWKRQFMVTYKNGDTSKCLLQEKDPHALYYHVQGDMLCSKQATYTTPPLKNKQPENIKK